MSELKGGKMKKKHFYQLDIIRAVCAVFVVCYHFSCACEIFEVQGYYNILYRFANGTWGEMAVSVFFMLSGAAMIYNYEGIELKLPNFYKKRWLTLFPMFYVMWILMYVIKASVNNNWFWGGEPKLMLLSLFGIDGYFYYRHPNYHSIGEWFLGAIIFLYMLFPILKKLFERFRWPATIMLTAAWGLIFFVDFFQVSTFHNLITCVWSFWIGMLLIEYRDYWKRLWPCFAACWIALTLWKLPVNDTVGMNLTAVAAFGTLFSVGDCLMKSDIIRRIVLSLSKNSYGIFLTHHVIIDSWVKGKSGIRIGLLQNVLWLLAVLGVSYISAEFLCKAVEVVRNGIEKIVKKRGRCTS